MSGYAAPVERPELRTSDGLLESPVLRELVELQLRRHGRGLVDRLDDPDPTVRARAAFALGSVSDADAEEALTRLLGDPAAEVRRDAAFALGRRNLADGGSALQEALASEEDPSVRVQMLRAIGAKGAVEAVEGVLGLEPLSTDEEVIRTRSLARAGLRGLQVPGLTAALTQRLSHPDPDVREAAALYFGHAPGTAPWAVRADRVRQVLDGYETDDPAAMHLVLALGGLGESDDLERLLHWIAQGTDWRIRVNAARGLGAPQWLERDGVRTALFRAMDDPSEHVRVAAARALTRGLWIPRPTLLEMAERIRGPSSDWRAHVPFLPYLAQSLDHEPVLEWTRRMADVHPLAAARGLEALADVPDPSLSAFVLEMTEHEDLLVRGAAYRTAVRRWETTTADEAELEALYERLSQLLHEGSRVEAMHAAQILGHPAFLAQGALDDLGAAARRLTDEGDPFRAAALLRVIAATGHPEAEEVLEEALAAEAPLLRRAAAHLLRTQLDRTVDLNRDQLGGSGVVDWDFLAELGTAPRLRIDTNRGSMTLRLAPEQAPLTVQVLARRAGEGAYDDLLFHRVEPNFVAQGGDVLARDGSGRPGISNPAEMTQIPFQRGIVGMASEGGDTAGTEFFITHSMQPHLDGQMTAFGWVETGREVLDRIVIGDRIESVTVEAANGT